MTEDRISGLLLAIPFLIIIYLLMAADKHYFNCRLTGLFKKSWFRVGFMVLVFLMMMLSAIYWRTYTY